MPKRPSPKRSGPKRPDSIWPSPKRQDAKRQVPKRQAGKRRDVVVAEFSLAGRPFIALANLLKVEGWCEHGAAAKHVIDSGAVTVDGEVELRRRCKIVAGQVVRLGDEAVKVVV